LQFQYIVKTSRYDRVNIPNRQEMGDIGDTLNKLTNEKTDFLKDRQV